MGENTFDPWAASAGLVESYHGKVTNPRFGYDAGYNNGQTCLLMLDVKTDAPELSENDGIDTLKLSCGDGWIPRDGGKSVAREDGKQRGFNNQSAVWVWISAAVEAGAGDAMKSNGGTPFQASTFDGLEFDFERVGYKDMGGKDRSRMLPVKFTAGGGGGGASAKDTGQASTPAPQVDPAVTEKLTTLAKECEMHDAFVERAFVEIEGVAGDAALEALVMDGAFWEGARAA